MNCVVENNFALFWHVCLGRPLSLKQCQWSRLRLTSDTLYLTTSMAPALTPEQPRPQGSSAPTFQPPQLLPRRAETSCSPPSPAQAADS